MCGGCPVEARASPAPFATLANEVDHFIDREIKFDTLNVKRGALR